MAVNFNVNSYQMLATRRIVANNPNFQTIANRTATARVNHEQVGSAGGYNMFGIVEQQYQTPKEHYMAGLAKIGQGVIERAKERHEKLMQEKNFWDDMIKTNQEISKRLDALHNEVKATATAYQNSMKSLNEENSKLKQEIEILKQGIAESDRKIAESDRKIAKSDKIIAECDRKIAESDKIIARCEKVKAHCKEKIQKMVDKFNEKYPKGHPKRESGIRYYNSIYERYGIEPIVVLN